MSDIITGALNTYSTDVTDGTGYPGDADTGLGQRQFISYVDELEPYNTRFLSKLSKGKAVWKSKLEAGIRVQTRHSVVLNEALDDTETAVTLASGDVDLIHPGMVLYIPADGTNDAEIVWVEDSGTMASGDDLNVIRAQGGTTAVAHDTGLTIQIIGVAMTDLSDHPLAPITFGDLFYNYRQRFAKKVEVDEAEDIQHNWEDPDGNIFERKLAKVAKDLKLQFEKALLLGRRQAGTSNASAKRPGMLSGIDHFAELSGNTYDLAGALFNVYDFETAIRDGMEEVDTNFGDLALINYNTQAIIDTAFNIKRQATMNDTTANLQMTRVTFGAGSVDFLAMPSNRWPDGLIDIVRMSDVKYYPYQKLDWHFARQKPGVDTDGDYAIGSISGDFNFLPEALAPMAQISGFDSDLDNYPRDLNA